MPQKALVLHPGRQATEVFIPDAATEPGSLHPRDYRELLPSADPDHLLLADCPFSHLTGQPVVVVYDASHRGAPNACASRLTTNVETGLEVEVNGDALVLYTAPGADFGQAQWAELDNVVYDELLEFFGQGLKPRQADLDRLVADFKAGRFQYSAAAADGGSGGDEDVNKDEGDALPGWG